MTADRDALIAQVRTLQEKWREAVYSARRTQPRSYHVSDMLQQQLLKCADELGELIDGPRRQEPSKELESAIRQGAPFPDDPHERTGY